ncbi:MAG: hypothetical protein M0T80_11420 [Actinomycetota bacterium]|nr:hypothetical protein [Actinomycetota bacterium]
MEIAKVDGATLDAFYGQLQRAGLGALTVRKSHAILSAAFSQAIRWGWIDLNPVVRSSPPSPRGREVRPPSLDELRRLVDPCAADHPDLGCLIYAAAPATRSGAAGDRPNRRCLARPVVGAFPLKVGVDLAPSV